MALLEIAAQLRGTGENILLVYAFNGTGKTQLCVAYKDHSKDPVTGDHTGVYYNAYSEDLFVWQNDEENDNANIRIDISPSSLNQFHPLLDEEKVGEKLAPYFPKFRFEFRRYSDEERGIESVYFYTRDDEHRIPRKISRGEERTFVWCFFLALFEVDGFADQQDAHFFIDDPVSSLDDYNIFVTTDTLFKLIEDNYLRKRIIITTHHIGLFSILADRLTKGEKSSRYKKLTKVYVLSTKDGAPVLSEPNGEVFLFHLHLLQTLQEASRTTLYAYHFVLLRQLLENIASFLGSGKISYVLTKIGVEQVESVANVVNSLSHKDAYQVKSSNLAPAEEGMFRDILSKLQAQYSFKF